MDQLGPAAVALDDQTETAVPTPQLYRVPKATRLLTMSRSVVYEKIPDRKVELGHPWPHPADPAAAISEHISLLLREADGDRTA